MVLLLRRAGAGLNTACAQSGERCARRVFQTIDLLGLPLFLFDFGRPSTSLDLRVYPPQPRVLSRPRNLPDRS